MMAVLVDAKMSESVESCRGSACLLGSTLHGEGASAAFGAAAALHGDALLPLGKLASS